MGLFGNKNKPAKEQKPAAGGGKKDQVQHYNLKNKLFPVSKPWGYSPQHVEEAIQGYTNVIENQKVAISKLKEEVTFYKKRYDQLETEFKNLQLQLNFVSVPSMNDIQEDYIQGKFKEKFQQSKAPESKDPFGDYDDSRSASEILDDSYSGPTKSKLSMIEEESQRDAQPGGSYEEEDLSEPVDKPKKVAFKIKKKPTESEDDFDHDVDSDDDFEDTGYSSGYGHDVDDDNDEEEYSSEEEYESEEGYESEENDTEEYESEDEYESEEYESDDEEESDEFEEEEDDGGVPEPPKTEPTDGGDDDDPSAAFLKNFGF